MKGSTIALDHLNGVEAAALVVDGQLQDLLIDTDLPRPGTIYRAIADRPMKGQGGMFLTTPDGKAAFVSEVTGLIAELGSEVERNHYVQLLARHVRMGEEYIKQRVDSSITTLRRTGRAPGSRREQTKSVDAPPADQKRSRAKTMSRFE